MFIQEKGIPLIVNGVERYFRGTITIVSADNPASTLLGGFKQSASAFRFCRFCNGTTADIQSKVCKNYLKLIALHVLFEVLIDNMYICIYVYSS